MASWQLCVYAGSSREVIDFVDGRFTVGAGDGDDVFVPNLENETLIWIFIDGVLTLISSKVPAYVDAKLVSQFPLDIGSGHVISAGDVHFAFGETGCLWPDAPEIAPPEEDVASEEIEAAVPEQVLQPAKIRAKDSLPLGLFAVVTALIAMGLVFGLTTVLSPDESYDPVAERIDRSFQELTQLVDEDPDLSGVQVRRRMDGTVILSGFTNSERAYAQLTNLTRQGDRDTDGYVRNDVVSMASLDSTLRETFRMFPVTFAIEEWGEQRRIKIKLSGVEAKQGQLVALLDQLEPQLRSGLSPWQLDIAEDYIDEADFLDQVLTIMGGAEVSQSFKAELQDGSLLLKGRYASSARARVDGVVERVIAFAERYTSVIPELFAERRIDWKVIAVAGGDNTFALLEAPSGVIRVRQGARLSKGERVDEIRDTGVSVKLEGYTYFIPTVSLDV